jgi:hypothetical protein
MSGSRTALFSRQQPGGLFTIENVLQHPGDIFFVGNAVTGASDAAGFGASPDAPFSTIDYAIGKCTANKGDVIYVLPGHAETISAATILVPDVDDVSIIGLGKGDSRPTLSYSLAAGNVPISGDNVVFKNILCVVSGAVDVVAGITVTGADCDIDVEMREGGATKQFIDPIIVDTGGDRARILLRYLGAAGDAGASGISIIAAVDGVEILEGTEIDGYLSAGCISNSTAACTNIVIRKPLLRERHATQDACVAMHANATGWLLSPRCRTITHDATGFTGAIVFAKGQVYDALVVNLDGEVGGVWGTASAAA